MKLTFREYSYVDGLTNEIIKTVKPTRFVKLRNDLSDEEVINAYHKAVLKESEQFERDCKITEYYLVIKDELMKLFGIDKDDMFADIDFEAKMACFGGLDYVEGLAYKWYHDGKKPLYFESLTEA